MRTTRTARSVLAGLLVLAATATASAQSADSTQTQIGGFNIEGYAEAGVRFFLDPSQKERAKFEEYRDINQGLYLQGLWLRFFTPDEKYSGVIGGRQWGLQDQEYHLSFERLGRWEVGFEWDQMRHIFSTNARTLVNETSRGVFALPNPRPPLINYNNGRSIDEISVRWDTARTFLKLSLSENADLFAEYTRIHKDGERPFGMAFGSPGGSAFEILQPIEHTIHDFRLRGTWATEHWQLQAGYTMSIFVNDLASVRADNPCNPAPVPAAPCPAVGSTGQFGTVSLPPNNMAHTFSLQGGVNLPMRTRISGSFTYGLRLQNEDFLPQTSTNSRPATTPSLALPQKSLNGNVQTILFNLTATSRPLPAPVTFTAKYRLYDLIDNSDVVKFSDFISNDQNAIARGPRFSERFSYMRQNADLDARWQVARPLAVTLGTGWERWDRSETREVRVSDEFFAKAAVDVTPADWLMIRATYLPSFRRIGAYRTFALAAVNQDAAPGEPGQSYLLRKYDESDRDRQRVDLMMQITPTETLTITPSASYRFDNHIASGLSHDASGVGQNGAMLGLQQAVSWSAGMDVNWAPVERLTFAAGYVHESIFQKQRSRNRNPDDPALDWISDNTDTVDTYHASMTARLIPGKLDLKFAGNYAYALGRVATWNPNANGSTVYNAVANTNQVARRWPAFEDSLLRLEASLKYHFAQVWTLSLNYAYEQFRKHDWRTDTIQPFDPGDSALYLG
ncbi:MAG: MtrB/PioB family decaheme-associated outer membrane protein, partial [Actinomycetota bacterium]|nr:MtrB/PioB family decaheme-associated outer membrane protein [Actinomycetota bacterium]